MHLVQPYQISAYFGTACGNAYFNPLFHPTFFHSLWKRYLPSNVAAVAAVSH